MGSFVPARFKLLAYHWPALSHVLRYVIVAILVSARACQQEREKERDGSARKRDKRERESILGEREYDYFEERRRQTVLVNKDRSRTTRRRVMVGEKRNEVREKMETEGERDNRPIPYAVPPPAINNALAYKSPSHPCAFERVYVWIVRLRLDHASPESVPLRSQSQFSLCR